MKAAVYNTCNGAIEIKQVDDPVVTETEAIKEINIFVTTIFNRDLQTGVRLLNIFELKMLTSIWSCCGGAGLSAVMIAAVYGAKVIAVDINEENLQRGKTFGAAYAINATC